MRDIWKEHLSKAYCNVRPSPIKELLDAIRLPGVISFAGGMPGEEVFPVEDLAEGAERFKRDGSTLFQYGTTEGDRDLRAFIAEWQEPALGRRVSPQEIILTTGSQQLLDIVAWTLLDPGDVVIVEQPTYTSTLSVFENHGAILCPIPIDEEGMQVDKLDEIIEEQGEKGRKVKLIYVIPNFQNPAGVTLSYERRKRLIQIAEKRGIPILEDDPYGYVRYEGEEIPSIFSLSTSGSVVYAGTISKVVSPGLRVGWAVGTASIITDFGIFKQFVDMCSSPLTHALLYEYCKKGYLQKNLLHIIDTYRVKRDMMHESLMRHLAPLGATWTKPQGGLFFWVDFGGVDTVALARKALEKKVAILNGVSFCVDPDVGKKFARLNFSYPKREEIEEGVLRLKEALIELRDSE